MADNEHTAVCIFTSRLRLPNAADWILKDITSYGLLISDYSYRAICGTTLRVVLDNYVNDPAFGTLFDQLSSPRQHRIVKIVFDDMVSWNHYLCGDKEKPSLDDRLSVATGMSLSEIKRSVLVVQPNTTALTVWDSLFFRYSIKK